MSESWSWRRIFRPSVRDEVREELAFHLEMRVRELVASGLSEEEARREAARRFGDVEEIGAECRRLGEEREQSRRRADYLAQLRQDVAFAVRTLWRSPGFTAIALLTIALGVAATTSVFSVVDGVLLRSLPYPGADRLVVPRSENRATHERWAVTYADYEDWRAAGVFGHVSVFSPRGMDLAGAGEPERVTTVSVAPDFLATLGVAPVLGRALPPESFGVGGPRAVLISYGLWQRSFGGRRDVVGTVVRLGGAPAEIAGVLPARMEYPAGTDAWLPLQIGPENRADYQRRDNYVYDAIARLAPGKTLQATRAELSALALRVERDDPAARKDVTVTAIPLADSIVGETTSRGLWLLLGAVALVLLVGCANVASLLLGRAAARSREFAVRAALGAGRGRLVRQLLTESLVLALVGGVLGVALSFAAVRGFLAMAPASLPRLDAIHVDAPVLAFALAVSCASALFLGLWPALQAGATPPGAMVAAGQRTTGGVGSRRGRDLLVAGELALSLVLLVGAGLLLRSFAHLRATDPGFRPDHVLTFSLSLRGERYTQPTRAAAYDALVHRLDATPGVRSAAIVSSLPLGGGGLYLGRGLLAEGAPEPPAGEDLNVMWTVVSPGYFGTLRIPLLRGRDFTAADDSASVPVVVVSRDLARKMFPGRDALGQRVRSWRDENVYRTIVGVVDDVRLYGAGDELRPLIYVPHRQDPWGSMSVVVRTAAEPQVMAPAVRAAVHAVDPNLAVADLATMERILSDSMASTRFAASLLAGFALLALVLAAIGVYGVLSYAVARRTREMGIRLALGARPTDVRRLVLRDALAVVIVGVAAGVASALLVTGAMSRLLYEVKATDPITFAAVPALLVAVALLAAWVPARRATRVDPAEAMRAE